MEDEKIIRLYFARDEQAIAETDIKYGRSCRAVAENILTSRQDSEECESDTYFKAWQTIPPTRPTSLMAYLARITRNLAINRYRRNKRGGEMGLILDELSEIIPDAAGDIDDSLDLRDAIGSFLDKLDTTRRIIFLRRYFYMMSVRDIAYEMGLSVGTVKSHLSRMRITLKKQLTERGITI